MGNALRLNFCSQIFGIPVIDYRRSSAGLLVSSGGGIMLAVMDACDRFRYAIDMDQCRGREDRLCDWLRAIDLNGLVDFIAFAGWFSISDPMSIANVLRLMRTEVLIYSGAGLARELFNDLPLVDNLGIFLRRATKKAAGRSLKISTAA